MSYNEEEVVRWMGERDVFYREELAVHLGLDYIKGDREARRIIADIAKRYPMISLSNGRGYKLITIDRMLENRNEIEHQIAENRSRAREVLSRNKPLIEARRTING